MRAIALAAIGCVLLTLVSCRNPAVRFVSVGVDNSPPFYIFQSDGSVRGLGVDVLSEAARRRKIHIRWVPVTDMPLDKALESRLVQMWPAISATPERREKLFFSEPWIETDYVLVSPKDKPTRTPREAAGLTVSHSRLQGATTLARRYLANSRLIALPDRVQAFREMCLGHTAATFIESRVAEAMLLDRPAGCRDLSLTVANVWGATTPLSIAAVPESAQLARDLRAEISKMALDGELSTLMDKWVPFSAEVGRSLGSERAEAVRNQYLTLFCGGSLVCALFLGFLAYRAHKLRRIAIAAEKEMRKQATEDILTHLANRKVFTEQVTRCVEQCHRGGESIFGVFFLDLDCFKVVNDCLGHLAGDKLLIEIAERLAQTVRSSDLLGRFSETSTVARLGGDEFVVLIENIQSLESALLVAERIRLSMSRPFLLNGHSVVATFSIGIALSSRDYNSADDILRDADTAMYAAKASGKGSTAVFDTGMRSRAVARLEVETDLRIALSTSQGLVVYYQPQVDLHTGELTGFEALVRWQHPKYGLIPPLEFIPIAEETGLIVPLGAWVLEEACNQIQRWRRAYSDFSNLSISVNLSCKQLINKDLHHDVGQALRVSLLPPKYLNLEVTESFLMEKTEAAIQTLLNLKDLGVGLQIDDFGTGYSSLSYLHRLPFDTLKIDRSFVQTMDVQDDGLEIVRTIMGLATGLKMSVIAEGVENQAQLSRLKQMGCLVAQGYYFSKPLDAVSAENFLAARSRVGSHLPELLLAS